MLIRLLWWLLVVATAAILALQLWGVTMYVLDPGYEALAFIVLFGVWGCATGFLLAGISALRWYSLSSPLKRLGLGVPLAVFFFTSIARALAA